MNSPNAGQLSTFAQKAASSLPSLTFCCRSTLIGP
jgi:hypothetical protein